MLIGSPLSRSAARTSQTAVSGELPELSSKRLTTSRVNVYSSPEVVVSVRESMVAGRTGVMAAAMVDAGPYPRILDTGCDYAAVGSVAARRAS